MFFLFSKILFFLTSPFFWWCIVLLLAFYLKSKIWRKRMRLLAIGSFLFFTNSFIFLEFERMWEIPGKKISEIQKIYDVGIVLSGMAMYNRDLERLQIQEGTDRIWHALTLYKKGIIRKILITGKDGTILDKGLNEAAQFKKDLVAWGIPASDILIEDVSRNTYENAFYTKKILDKHPDLQTKLLITSSNHIRRARACFVKQGIQFETFSTNVFNGKKRYWDLNHVFVPSFDTFLRWNGLTKEWIGYLMYKITQKI